MPDGEAGAGLCVWQTEWRGEDWTVLLWKVWCQLTVVQTAGR